METKPIDRYGICPNKECQMDWNGGDILQHLRKLDVFGEKTEEELVNLAFRGYGYEVSKPKSFSKVVAVSSSPTKIDFYQCPDCRQVWDATTGKHYNSLMQAKALTNEQYSREFLEPSEE